MAPIIPRVDGAPLLNVETLRSTPATVSRLLSNRPSRTVGDLPSKAITARQVITTSTIPGGYNGQTGSPDPGTIVGITLGAVAGFLILLYLIYMCMSLGNPSDTTSLGTASVVTRKSRRSHRHSHATRRETVEVRTARGTPIVMEREGGGERVEKVIVEERRRSVSRPPVMVPPPPRTVHSDDEVVVIEEHSPPRRHRSKRRSSGSTRRESRRESGFREVDPDRYAGGDAPMRGVRGSRRRSRS